MKKLFLVWYEKENKILNKIGELSYDGTYYYFRYLNYENNDLQLFSKNGLFYGFEDINLTYKSKELFFSIKSRIPSKKRIDYKQILNEYRLNDSCTDFDLLEKTKGRISTDNFLFITEDELKSLI